MDWVCFFIPALWQGATTHSNLFFPSLWDASELKSTLNGLNQNVATAMQPRWG
jgi:hypothetical protein